MESSNKKTVLVTGAGGFIGLNVVREYIKHGWTVYALIHNNYPKELKNMPNLHIIRGDMTDEKFINNLNIKVDVVAHVAGLATDIGKDETFRKINYHSVINLMKIPEKKFIFVSSTDVYGIMDLDDAKEESELVEYPKNPYPRYKIMSETYIRRNCKIPYIIVRPAAVYGKNDKTLEGRFLDFLKISPFIVHFGKWKGKNRWPLCDVENVAKTILCTSEIDNFDNQAINVIDPKVTTIDQYYNQLARKYFPKKQYTTITLPFWLGELLGIISTSISNLLGLKHPIFEPTHYAAYHVSSNLDISSIKMQEVLALYKELPVIQTDNSQN